MTTTTFTDHRGVPLAIGDRIIPTGWGEIPLWLSNSRGTIVKFGRKRLHVKFDGVRYDETLGDKPHTIYPTSVRRLDEGDR